MTSRSMPSTFVKNVMQNGMGRYVCQMQRVILNFCKSDPNSLGMRNFIENHLLDFTKANPGVVVYLKPRRHRAARITGVYLNGNAHVIRVSGKTKDEICKYVEIMKNRSGVDILRLRKTWHTDTSSIQGPWHPFVNKDTVTNTRTFPCPKAYEFPVENSATERLLKRAEELRQLKNKQDSSSS